MSIRFCKYQALGNDYLVLADDRFSEQLNGPWVQRLCDRHYGVGADGVLAVRSATEGVGVTIWNADGSLAEKSGNGLRIFARFLWDEGRVARQPICIAAAGGDVHAELMDDGVSIRLGMGTLRLHGAATVGATVQPETLRLDQEKSFDVYVADLGNPHCVIFVPQATPQVACEWGKKIETHARFPQRTNVQFVRVVDRHRIQLEIWERGSGYTMSSGSSAAAAVGVSCSLGLVDRRVEAQMQGGVLEVTVGEDNQMTICGPTQKIADIILGRGSELFTSLAP